MSCNSCNRNTPQSCATPYGNTCQMYRSSQMTRNQQMRQREQMNRGNMTRSTRTDTNCGCSNEQSTDYRHPACPCTTDTCNQATAPVDSMMLAMAYVPWQQWGEIYDFDKALSCGTIFVDLNKPWIGRGCD